MSYSSYSRHSTVRAMRFLRTLAFLAALALCAQNHGAEPEDKFWQETVQPFLSTYCLDCHSGDGAEAEIDFASYTSGELLSSERPRWNQVRGMIEIGAMPPNDYDPQPSREERELLAQWIDNRINSVDCNVVHDPGRVTMRRLNSVEYDNTLRDLFGIDFSPSSILGFPSDGVGNGFDNQGDVLSLSALQIEKYMQAAQLVASRIIVHDRDALRQQERSVPALYLNDKQSVAFDSTKGQYKISARLEFQQDGKDKVTVALLIDGTEAASWEVGDKRSTHSVEQDFEPGKHELTLHYVSDPGSETKVYRRRVEVQQLTIEGPKDAEPLLPEPHRRLFVAYPQKASAGKQAISLEDAARTIFEPLMRRAFRRDLRPEEIERTIQLVKMASDQGESFENAVALGLKSVLVSPHFLFRVENEGILADDTSESVADDALASRLSYFLWASMPDDELLELAREGKLRDVSVLESQATRMLADPKSEALVSRFFGQFLGLGGLRDVTPDTKQFPQWNSKLRDALRHETELFCREIIANDLPLDAMLNGEFTFSNPRLAEFYGLEFEGRDPVELYRLGPGLRRDDASLERELDYLNEDRWIRVQPPEGRKGVLTQAAILTLTSNPTSTSPVKRGKWILESLLGDPPPPAPPNVPNFDTTKKEHADLTLRQQLEIHRANPSCASCHRVMDPLGLGFENFDALGRWRDEESGHPIDAAGELADGRKFNGPSELLALLTTRKQEIARHFAESLLTYALGRGLEPYDNCAVDEIMLAAEAQDFRVSSLIQAVVASKPFSQRRLETEATQVATQP